LSGLEWAGGLPGTLGGAIRGNAGCFKGEIKDVISAVESFDTETGKMITRNNADCGFAYRTSVFKQGGGKEIILSAVLALKPGDALEIAKAIQEKIDYRVRRHPMDSPSIGSIFKNVDLKKVPEEMRARFASVVKQDPFPVIPTAHLISEAGLKGVSFGGAMVSPKHPNFIVNVLEAKASDVKNLIELVKSEVKNKFGIELEEEVMEI
jgi:UDP-N-acetylmuramate dehydrogenase